MSDAIEATAQVAPSVQEHDHEALRSQVRAVQAQTRKSLTQMAKMAGIGDSTFIAWMGGTYPGRNDLVAQKVANWLRDLEAQSRARAAAPISFAFIETKTATSFLAALQQAQFIPDLVVISGGAGVGKTTACRQYERTHPNVWMITGERAISTGFGTLERLCQLLSVREHTPEARSREITKRMTGSQGLIIVDEAQHLKTEAIEQLRSLHDAAGVGLALVGNHEVWSRIDGGGRRAEMAQLFSRVGMRVQRLKPYRDDIEAILDGNGVEGAEVRKMLSAIGSKPGALRGMVKTLRVARMFASAGGEELNEAHVANAWSRLSDAAPIAAGGA